MVAVSAAILAGGRGERLGVLGYGRAKAVLPFGGESRLIDFALNNCIQSAIPNIAVLVQHEAASISSYLKQVFLRRRQSWAGDLRLCQGTPGSSREYLGTAHAVYVNLPLLLKGRPEAVMVLASDHIYCMDYGEMLAFHRERGADITVAVVDVSPSEASRFGIVQLTEGGRVRQFLEKPLRPPCTQASMSVYVFNPGVLADSLAHDVWDPASEHDFGHSLLPRLVRSYQVFGYQFQGYWRDVGTVEAYWQAHMDLLQGELSPLEVPSRYLLGKAGESPSLVYSGCLVEGRVENSVLFSGVRVARGALVQDSVVLSGSIIETGSLVANAVLDEGVQVGPFCHIGSRAGSQRSLTVIGRHSAIPRGTVIGAGCTIYPHAVPQDFPSSVIPAGTTIVSQGEEALPLEAVS